MGPHPRGKTLRRRGGWLLNRITRDGQAPGAQAGPSGRNAIKRIRLSTLVGGTLLSLACAHVPPSNVARDRFDYAEALAQSWKRQTLMNVVHIRYGDAPVFLDVTSLINTYTRVNNVNASAGLHGDSDDNVLSAGGSATWSNSPTVTYQPVTGDKFAKQLLRPIPPASLLQMMEAGWPAKLIRKPRRQAWIGCSPAWRCSLVATRRAWIGCWATA